MGLHKRVVVMIVLSGVLLGIAPSEARAEQSTHEWNMAGAAMNFGDPLPADIVIYLVALSNPQPLVVSMVEVCNQQYIRMRNALEDLGYSALWVVTRTAVPNCSNQSFGNVVFVKSGGSFAQTGVYTYSAQVASPEQRRIGCGRVNAGAFGVWVGRSTHLVNHRDTARLQADEAIFWVNYYFGSYWRFIGGDFNLIPTDTKFDIWYSGYSEADGTEQQSVTHETLTDGRKLDYVWMDRAHGLSTPPATRSYLRDSENDLISDHTYYSGRFG